MLSKRSLGLDLRELPPKKRFRANLGDLVLSNTISAERASSLFSDAASSGARHVRDLTRVGGPKHRHRNLLTRLLRGNQWPALYWGEVRFWNPRARAEQFAKIPLLLPHEVVGTVRKKNATSEAILARTSFDTMDIEYMAGLEGKVGATPGSMLGLALWLDGVAARWDRTESIDTVVLSFPGWAGRWRDARIPLAAIEHSRVSKNTMHDILAILKWSLFQAFLGQYPQSRHDGTPWTKGDGKRKRLAGAIGCRSALIRITGDWKMWKEIFKFPQWNETAGCCFRCAVTPGGLKDTGLSAPWRRRRLSHWDNIIRLRANALPVAPLFGLPHFDIAKICRLDWLHAADQGVAADYKGQLYKFLLPRLGGGNPSLGLDVLW